MNNLFYAIRQYERLIYKGVPEQWESVWEREGNGSYARRLTGKSPVADGRSGAVLDEDQFIAKVIFRPDKIEVVSRRQELNT